MNFQFPIEFRWRKRWWLVAAVIVLALPFLSSDAVDEVTIYFFSPETNVNNYNALKSEFDAYFSAEGDLKFQPLSSSKLIEKYMVSDPGGLFLMSSWHFQQLKAKAKWRPVLVGIQKNQPTQKHLLYVQKDVKKVDDLKYMTIATSGSLQYSETVLREILGDDADRLIDSIKILVVPKDIDALLAVSFSAAGAAIATENGIDKLSRINPKQLELFRPMGNGSESFLPVLVMQQGAEATLEEKILFLKQMGEQLEGRQRLKMLGLDELRQLAAAQHEELMK